MSEHADFINGLRVVECELERVIGELDEMQDRRGIPTHDRVSLKPLQWALNKLADDLHDATVEICNARLYEASAKREADEAQQQQQAEQLQSLSIFNGLRAELETVKAERDSLQQQVAELTEKLGELPDEEDEPFPEPYQWQVGDEIECPGVTRRKVVGTCRPWVSLEGIQEACPQPEWERRGWKLYRKASELPPQPAPEPYQWQVGDEVKRDDGTIHTISQAIGGLLWFKDQTIGVSAQWWLSENGCALHRKASDIPQPPEPAPEPYDWQVGDEIEDDGGVRRPVTDRDAKGWVSIKGNGALPQFEWERRRWKLYRKASELPDIPPFTEQQVAEFAAVTEPFDDSVSAAAADEGRP
jgi:hypothetical protein